MVPVKKFFSDRTVPLVLALICLITFGLFIPWLGFYWDDWPVLMMFKFFRTSAYVDFYIYDRPFSAWTYVLTAPLLGLNPVAWQLFTLVLRWLTSLFVWLSLRLWWPERQRETAWMAILFLIYPVFSLQFISVAFSQHWICFLLYSISFWAMLKAWSGVRRPRLYLILSYITSALHLWTIEYFLGMEIFRLVVIWTLSDSTHPQGRREQLIAFFKRAWPFVLILATFVFWRLFVLKLPEEDPNRVQFITDLKSQPINGIIHLIQIALRDLIYMLVQVWSNVLDPNRIELVSKFFLFALLVSGVVAVGMVFYLLHLDTQDNTTEANTQGWIRRAILLGFLAILLGSLPGWLTYREALTVPYGNRIALPSMLGLSIFMVAFLEWLTSGRTQKVALLGFMIGVSVFSHLYTADYYREAWKIQKQFYWQLYWRAPYILPQTALLSDSEVIPSAGTYSTAAALNMIYAEQINDLGNLPYWFFNMSQKFGGQYDRFLSGKSVYAKFRNWGFVGKGDESLLINNDGKGCAYIIVPDRIENSLLSDSLQAAVANSNLSRILSQSSNKVNSPSAVFGSEPPHTWCFYYEKAELAK